MKSIKSFQELAKLQENILSKQSPTSLEEMRAQVMLVKFGNEEDTLEIYLEKYRRGDFDHIYNK